MGIMKALVIHVDLGDLDRDAHAQEFLLLARSAGARVVGEVTARRSRPDPAYFIGSGKVKEISALIRDANPDVVLFDQPLSPAQQRNLERAFGVRVVDRVLLILDIFALRAQSREGKLQVELAQLQHLSTRLTGLGSQLEQQQGGIGLRGPGESQLELDRRLIGRRVKLLRERIKKVRRQRATQRRSRLRSGVMTVSLVGYTNAGKSTLFNALTRSDAYTANKLFATLDTTTRRVWVEGTGQVVVSDTVGFIRDLPPTLVAAFRATLEETVSADVLFHVVDNSSSLRDEHIQEVNKVLADIGADHIPCVMVYNKIDLTGHTPRIDYDDHGTIARVLVSAEKRLGLDLLRETLVELGQIVETNGFNV